MGLAFGLGAYLTVSTFFLPQFASVMTGLKEKKGDYEWTTADSVSVALSSLCWPLVLAHALVTGVARMFRGSK